MNFQMKLNKKVEILKKSIYKLDFTGVVVSSQEPKEKLGTKIIVFVYFFKDLYWGYKVRIVDKLSQLKKNELFESFRNIFINFLKDFDLKICVGKKGLTKISNIWLPNFVNNNSNNNKLYYCFLFYILHRNILITFCGNIGIETLLENEELSKVASYKTLFNIIIGELSNRVI